MFFYTRLVFYYLHRKLKPMKKRILITAVIIGAFGTVIISACNNKSKNYAENDVVFKDMDTTVKPGDDFFKYANGGWLKKNPIPPAYSSWGIGNVVEEELRDRQI